MHSYATLSVLEAHLLASAEGNNLAQNRAILMDYARRVTARIDTITRDTFAPVRQTRYFDCIGDHIDPWSRTLYLQASIAEVVQVTDGTGAILALNTDWRYSPRAKQSTQFLEGLSDTTWTRYADNWRAAIAIDGVWCHRHRYDVVGWMPSADTVGDVSLSASDTTITVTDTGGVNGWGVSPRFDVGQMIAIGTEYMVVMAVSATTLTVLRGYNGTVATPHAQGDAIMTFHVQEDITRACALMVTFNYANRGKYERVRFDGINATETIEMPEEVGDLLAPFMIRDAYGV